MMKSTTIQQHPVLLEENMSNLTSASGEASVSSNQQQSSFASPNPNPNPVKKKRSLPGNPDPEAEVVALSPTSLLARNRFMCEICNKGFQRDQNLQLHRRGHNLPWKLKQRSNKEVKKKVYICPEVTCVHHDPSRALGDLTGIKKHFCRKHGEKKWKCEKCSKKYAVQSDWKAHSKTCGTREYRCDCGTLFSRRDSFITHRAFCDALAEESARVISANPVPINHHPFLFSQAAPAHDHSSTPLPNFTANSHGFHELQLKKEHQQQQEFTMRQDLPQWLTCQGSNTPTTYMSNMDFPASLFSTRLEHEIMQQENNPSNSLPPSSSSSCHASAPPQMSATALLQRAAQMGATMGRPSRMATAHTSTSGSAPAPRFGLGLVSSPQPQELGGLVHGSAPPSLVNDTMMPSLPSAASGFDGSFEDVFGGMLATKREANTGGIQILARKNEEAGFNGGKAEGMTRDFLGLTHLSHTDLLSMAGLDASMSSYKNHHHHQQSKEPWHG